MLRMTPARGTRPRAGLTGLVLENRVDGQSWRTPLDRPHQCDELLTGLVVAHVDNAVPSDDHDAPALFPSPSGHPR